MGEFDSLARTVETVETAARVSFLGLVPWEPVTRAIMGPCKITRVSSHLTGASVRRNKTYPKGAYGASSQRASGEPTLLEDESIKRL